MGFEAGVQNLHNEMFTTVEIGFNAICIKQVAPKNYTKLFTIKLSIEQTWSLYSTVPIRLEI